VARRKYRPSAAISTAGQSDRPREATGDESLQQPIEPRTEYGKAEPASEPSPHFQTGLGDQLRQQQQHAQLAQLHAYINAIPNLSAAQRQWLAAHPHALHRFDLLHAAHQMAQAHGIAPDSGDYFRVLESALHHYGHLPTQHTQAQPAPAPAPPVPPPMPEPEHAVHVDVSEPEEPPMSHYAAPVSRGSEHYAMSGEHEPSAGRITLSKAEREHAAAAGVSEEIYAQNKLKMLKMKKANVIKD
jgi:hypothetical protein